MTQTSIAPRPPKALSIGLWTAQVLGAGAFAMAGITKLTTPIANLATMMPWAGELPEAFVRTMGAIDLAGGLGLLLPSLTRILPRLTPLAASGCVLLQICAIVFHVSRGETSVLPLNAVLLALSVFILWGRGRKAPISPRQ